MIRGDIEFFAWIYRYNHSRREEIWDTDKLEENWSIIIKIAKFLNDNQRNPSFRNIIPPKYMHNSNISVLVVLNFQIFLHHFIPVNFIRHFYCQFSSSPTILIVYSTISFTSCNLGHPHLRSISATFNLAELDWKTNDRTISLFLHRKIFANNHIYNFNKISDNRIYDFF